MLPTLSIATPKGRLSCVAALAIFAVGAALPVAPGA
jgi:hypothetical protein